MRLGHFGQAFKKRLSKSRVSKESAKTIVKDGPSQSSPEMGGMASGSYTSTGLTDLLVSRTANDDGYDRDATAVSTLGPRESSNPGPFKTSSEYSTEAPRSQNNASPEKTSPTVSIPEQKPGLVGVTAESQDIYGGDAFYDTAFARADVQEGTVAEGNRLNCSGTVQQSESQKMSYSTSLPLSDTQSIHLADVRMPQQPASTSVMPLSSANLRSSAERGAGANLSPDMVQTAGPQLPQHVVANGLPLHLQGEPSMVGRHRSFIAQEHNRKPSDPRTKELFENPTDASRLRPKWNSLICTSCLLNKPHGRDLARKDANSHHMVKGELLGSGTASLTEIVRSGAINNPNSLAVPGRNAAANMGQGQARIGQWSNAEEGSWFGESKHKNQHPQQESKDALAPHKKGSEGTSMTCIRGGPSRESRFTEEATYHQSTAAPTFLSSAEVNEGMGEVGEGAGQEKKHEGMSEMAPNLEVPKTRPCHSSDETWSTGGGWLTQGGKPVFGYNFIERTNSRDSQLPHGHQDVEGPAGETAAVVGDQVLKSVGEGGYIESSSKSMLDLPFWSNFVRKRPSGSRFNGYPRRSRAVASEWK